MDIEVIVPLLLQKLHDLLAHEGNIYPRSTVLVRMTETKLVLDAVSRRIGDAEKRQVRSDLAGLERSEFLRMLDELENIIDTFIVKIELQRQNVFIEIMPPLIYLASWQDQTQLSLVMDKITNYAKCHLPLEEIMEPITSTTDLHTRSSQTTNSDSQEADDSNMVGLEDKVDELLERLFHAKDEESDNVIVVTGNAGSGKTVLTKTIYNAPFVRRCFVHRAWVDVSEDFEAREVLLNILTEFGWERKDEILLDNDLQMMLKSFLKGKQCLIVVDDVRTPYDLDKLSVVLKCIGGWSRLILTTRNIDIAHAANQWRSSISLRSLTDEESWTLFLKKARIAKDSLNSPVLNDLKRDIQKKCGGSPLAIIILGGLLSTRDLSLWSDVFKHLVNTDLSESPTVFQPADQRSSTTDIRESFSVTETADQQSSTTELREPSSVTEPAVQKNIVTSSYELLSSRIKFCVLYFGLFPRAFKIPVRRLFHLWFAEGLVIPLPEDNMAPEGLAKEFLRQLKSGNWIEVIDVRLDGSPKTYRMPGGIWDVLNPVAVSLGRFYNIITTKSAKAPNIRRLVRDAILQLGRDPYKLYIENYSSLVPYIQNLRSYVSFDAQKRELPTQEIGMFLNAIVTNRGFGMLIVLDLEEFYKPMLPETLGKLLQLKYLGLRWTFLDSLPKSVGNLPYLETLDVKHTNIISLPSSIWKAKNLRHLYLNEIHFDRSVIKPDSGSLTKLEILWGLFIGNESLVKNCLSKLTGLKKLKLTCTSKSERAIANWIAQLSHLQSLKLRSINEFGRPSTLSLVTMTTHHKLSDLYLLGRLSRAIGEHHFPPNLKILTLSASRVEEDPMQILGKLLHLNILRLLRDSYSGTQMTCPREGFPELRVLKLWMLDGLEEWIVENGAMPRLRELEIRCCNSLKQPDKLQLITTLTEVILTNMPPDFVANVKGVMVNANVKEVKWTFAPLKGVISAEANVSEETISRTASC